MDLNDEKYDIVSQNIPNGVLIGFTSLTLNIRYLNNSRLNYYTVLIYIFFPAS